MPLLEPNDTEEFHKKKPDDNLKRPTLESKISGVRGKYLPQIKLTATI
jgi:hypothetical protein